MEKEKNDMIIKENVHQIEVPMGQSEVAETKNIAETLLNEQAGGASVVNNDSELKKEIDNRSEAISEEASLLIKTGHGPDGYSTTKQRAKNIATNILYDKNGGSKAISQKMNLVSDIIEQAEKIAMSVANRIYMDAKPRELLLVFPGDKIQAAVATKQPQKAGQMCGKGRVYVVRKLGINEACDDLIVYGMSTLVRPHPLRWFARVKCSIKNVKKGDIVRNKKTGTLYVVINERKSDFTFEVNEELSLINRINVPQTAENFVNNVTVSYRDFEHVIRHDLMQSETKAIVDMLAKGMYCCNSCGEDFPIGEVYPVSALEGCDMYCKKCLETVHKTEKDVQEVKIPLIPQDDNLVTMNGNARNNLDTYTCMDCKEQVDEKYLVIYQYNSQQVELCPECFNKRKINMAPIPAEQEEQDDDIWYCDKCEKEIPEPDIVKMVINGLSIKLCHECSKHYPVVECIKCHGGII